MFKRTLSVLLAGILAASMLPISVFAQETTKDEAAHWEAVNGDIVSAASVLEEYVPGEMRQQAGMMALELFSGAENEILSGLDVGDYRFYESESNNAKETANRIYDDYTISGEIDYGGDLDYYRFELKTSGYVSIVGTSATANMAMELYQGENSGNPVRSTMFSSSSTSSYLYSGSMYGTFPAGVYYLVLMNTREYTGDYMLYLNAAGAGTQQHEYKEDSRTGSACAGWNVTYRCIYCDDVYTVSKDATDEHLYKTVREKEPTCTQIGVESDICATCGKKVSVAIPALGHDYREIDKTGSGCEGWNVTFRCRNCGDEYVKRIASTNGGHEYRQTSREGYVCTGWDVKYTCVHCDDAYSVREDATDDHIYETTREKAPTCTEPGVNRHTCATCGQTGSSNIPALGHDYKSVVTAPTCTAKGYTTHTCTRCADSYKDSYVAALGHNMGAWVTDKVPTCVDKGAQHRACSRCDHRETRELDALGHDYKSVVTAPTCVDEGYTTHTCSRCADSYVDTPVAALGHDYKSVVTAPTCTEKGYTTHTCSRCDDSYVDTPVAALGHNYKSVVTAPTCTAKGYTTHTCTRCDDSRVDSYVNALGHKWDAGKVTKRPTANDEGVKTFTCTLCKGTRTEAIARIKMPTGLAVAEDGESVKLTWNAVEGAARYAVYRSVDGSPFKWLAGPYTNEYVDTDVERGHTYSYQVCFYKKTGGVGEKTPAQSITLKIQLKIPAKPYDIKNVVNGVHVYWKATEGADKYGLWRSENGKNGTYKWIANPKDTHFTDTKVESGKTYFYKVTSMDVETNTHSEKSEARGIIYTATPDITKRVNTSQGVTLTWNTVQGASGYAVYRRSYEGTDAWARVGTIPGGENNTWTDTSVKNNNGSIYRYTVRALGGADMKTLSGCRNNGRTMVRLSSQVLKSAARVNSTSVRCTWTTSRMVTGYEIRFMVGDEVAKTVVIDHYRIGTQTITGLKARENYTVQVRTSKTVPGVGTFYSDWSAPKRA